LTTRTLKIVTGSLIALTALLFIAWPFLIGGQPSAEAPVAIKRTFVIRSFSYIAFVVFLLVLTSIGAIWIMRRTVAEVRAQQVDNMKHLIETTLEAHKTKADPDGT
jgi:cytochrome bd-type quinol oxidase subunit 2